MPSAERLRAAYLTARDALLAERVPAGHWVGELSTSALSTATAVMALHLANPFENGALIDAGLKWLADHQNADGGWGDTVKSFSNISTTMLCRAAFRLIGEKEFGPTVERVEDYLNQHAGGTPARRAAAIRARYGKDHTFSVPILMTCAVAGLVPWAEVPRLPFEVACLPQSWYRFARMPVVSYALPALIAIGQCIHHHRRSRNPLRNAVRRLARGRTLKVLRRIQPTTGGYLEATPLTSFVVMALSSIRRRRSEAEQQVISEGVRFVANSVRPDGSWPIDTNLATWVTTLSVNALASAGDLESLDTKEQVLVWLLKQQYTERHPYTGADPGGWAWTDLPGGVPDCDDTPGALLALFQLAPDARPETVLAGLRWVLGLQNRDGGAPTFCRGWGTLPFDRSGADLTAHALRSMAGWWRLWGGGPPPVEHRYYRLVGLTYPLSAIFWNVVFKAPYFVRYLAKQQRADGSWLPLWFGNQHAPDDVNPVYGTARVLAAYRDLGLAQSPECQRGVAFLLSAQNADGGWGGAKDCPSSVEETALAVEVLSDLTSPLEGEVAIVSSRSRVGGEPSAVAVDAPACDAVTPSLPPTRRSAGQNGDLPLKRGGQDTRAAVERGLAWLVDAVESGRFREPSPIGFYFAKLWYFETLYPLIFTVAALGRATRDVRA